MALLACRGYRRLSSGQAWQLGRPMQEALVVRRETHIPAPPAAVFALLTDPEKILRWMGTEAQLEPQPGGLYLVNVTGARLDRQSVVSGKRVSVRLDLGGRRIIQKKNTNLSYRLYQHTTTSYLLTLT